jgi:kynurenine formamidase
LVGLGRIHRKQFDLVVLPLRLSGATGSPVRAIAV